MDISINYPGVLAAAVASMGVGAIWYAKPVFGKQWQAAIGLKDKQLKQGSSKAMLGAFAMSLLTAYVLAHTIELSHYYFYFQYSYLVNGIVTALFLWLGIQAASNVTHSLFEQSNKTLLTLRLGRDLVALLTMGIVIALVR